MSGNKVSWKLNGTVVQSEKGQTVLQSCRRQGIAVPSLCKGGESGHSPSCMVCFVEGEKGLIPSCSLYVEEGLSVRTETESVEKAVKESCAMLLNEHGGDCYAPCSLACRGDLDSAYMSRFIRSGSYEKAARYAFGKLVLPQLLSRLCNSPCTGACRRNKLDAPVDIPSLHGKEIMDHFAYSPVKGNGKAALISGSSPETWAAAHFLNLKGYEVTLASNDLRDFLFPLDDFTEDFQCDRNRLVESGIRIIGPDDFSPDDLNDFEYILNGEVSGHIEGQEVLKIEEKPHEANLLRRLMSGRDIVGRLTHKAIGEKKKQISSIQAFSPGEKELFIKHYGKPSHHGDILEEASSCLLCRCSAVDKCELKKLAMEKEARGSKGIFLRSLDVPSCWGELVYEFSKCINCRLCVKKSRQANDLPQLGIAFKGLKSRIIHKDNRPFDKKEARTLVRLCPTGALRMRYSFEK